MESIAELIQDIGERPKDGILLRYADRDGIHSTSNAKFISDIWRCADALVRKLDGEPAGRQDRKSVV